MCAHCNDGELTTNFFLRGGRGRSYHPTKRYFRQEASLLIFARDETKEDILEQKSKKERTEEGGRQKEKKETF